MVLTPNNNGGGDPGPPESRKGGTTGTFFTPVQGQTSVWPTISPQTDALGTGTSLVEGLVESNEHFDFL